MEHTHNKEGFNMEGIAERFGGAQTPETLRKQIYDLHNEYVNHKAELDKANLHVLKLKEKSKEFSSRKKFLTIQYLRMVGSDIRCPICGHHMRKITFQKSEFYGCLNYPNCKGTLTKYEEVRYEQKEQNKTIIP